MADFDYDGPADPGPRHERLHVPPVEVRLVGRDLDIIRALDVLREVFTVSDVSRIMATRDGRTRVYFTVSRDFPYSGGRK